MLNLQRNNKETWYKDKNHKVDPETHIIYLWMELLRLQKKIDNYVWIVKQTLRSANILLLPNDYLLTGSTTPGKSQNSEFLKFVVNEELDTGILVTKYFKSSKAIKLALFNSKQNN